MKFKVTIAPYTTFPATGADFVLADDSVAVIKGNNFTNGAGGALMDGFLGDVDDKLQITPLFRGTYQQVDDRGNLIEAFNLTVERNHDTETNAVNFLFTHPAKVPRAGLIKVVVTCSNGTARFYMPNGKIGEITRPKQTGTRMTWIYACKGNGPWLTSAPAP